MKTVIWKAAMQPSLVLASTSLYRRQLLAKTGLIFHCQAPEIDETPFAGEDAASLVQRLAREKACAVAQQHDQAWVIGSDQVCVLDGQIVGKPESPEQAYRQLALASGQVVTFYTGLCLQDSASGRQQLLMEPFNVHFRRLTPSQIQHYLQQEQPYDCAGSFKSEGLGICLFERLEGRDPNTLIGLPLMALIDMLANWGLVLPLATDQTQEA